VTTRGAKLQQIVGHLAVPESGRVEELARFERTLAEHLRSNPNLTIRGNTLSHQSPDETAGPEARVPDFDAVAGDSPLATATTPLIFRRETAFRSNLLGNSVPEWAVGTAPTESFGPFVDEHGLKVWFDIYLPAALVSFTFSGASAPVLRATVRRTLIGTQSYRLQAGSIWIASSVIAKVAALQGYYTGLRITGGSVELSQAATVSNGTVALAPTATVNVHLDLDPPAVSSAAGIAGVDAAEATVQLPKTLDLIFQLQSSTVRPGPASCTIFGCETDFTPTGQAPIWNPAIAHILVPMAAATRTNSPDHFEIVASKSALCTVAGRAPIEPAGTGWVLPATKADPLMLGVAAGVGALGIAMAKGLTATWKDLKGSKTTLLHPGVVIEPGLVTVLDFTASNLEGRQRWTLWRNAANAHHSQMVLTFGKLFPFVFVSSAASSEGVFCFCRYQADIDRPVDANGRPFGVRSPVAFAATLQTDDTFHALLFDNDALEDEILSQRPPRQYSLILRNAVFAVGGPRSLALFGDLDNGRITKGTLALTHDIHRYLPTLPDPYVATYTPYLRDPAALGFGRLQQALTGFVKWPNLSPVADEVDETDHARAFVYYRLTPPQPPRAIPETQHRNFQSGVATFDRELPDRMLGETAIPQGAVAAASQSRNQAQARSLDQQIIEAVRSGALAAAVTEIEQSPLLRHMSNRKDQINLSLEATVGAAQRSDAAAAFAPSQGFGSSQLKGRGFFHDPLMLLDVSSRADQMGVTIGPALRLDRDERGNTVVRHVDRTFAASSYVPDNGGLPLQIANMDVVASCRNVRAATLPHISWEPVWNIPLPIEGGVAFDDTITTTPGPVVYENDGIATRIFSESPFQVPIAPLPIARHFLKEYNDEKTPRQLHSVFTLPFAMLAQADFTRNLTSPAEANARLNFNTPRFGTLRGGLQIKALAPASSDPAKVGASFPGWTIQLDDNIRWVLFGLPLTGSTLGKTVRIIFNKRFPVDGSKPAVPVEKMEFSGYGASIFSNWWSNASIADVSQVQFDVVVGRTAHEVVQVRSILYPFGVHVVRTITLTRSNNGYVFRSDSGWKAESDGFYDFSYTLDVLDIANPPKTKSKPVANPYEFHAHPVKGVSNVREIRDFPDGGTFNSSFQLNDPDLPPELKTLLLAEWQSVFKPAASLNHVLDVHLQAVVFDADVHLENVTSGGQPAGPDFLVQSRKMLGYVQLAPSSILIPDRLFAELLNSQNGSLGGPVDCVVDVAKSKQRMRVSRVDVNPAKNAAGKSVFVTAARGSLVLPQDGSWSVVKQQTTTGDVHQLPAQELVPLIKPNANPNFLVSHPADVYVPTSNVHYGVVQSTGTQKLLFDVPQFTPGTFKLKSAQTYYADAYKLLNSKGIFPNIANGLGLTGAEREVEILGEGLMKMAERTLHLENLLPDTYTYAFVDEPGVLRIYAQYKTKSNTKGRLTLGIDSAAALADRWKAALANMRIVVDLGPFPELMWVNGNFNAKSGISTKFDKPHLQFGEVLDPAIQILQILATLSGDDFDRGMDVGMSNSPDNWEYKFDCSKEIPVIKFPSPLQLTINPNPPLKLEAGLRVGFYFNQVLSIPTNLKQLVPACGAYVEFYGRLQVQCFTLAVASVYGVGQVTLGIAADSKAGITVHMKFGFGAEVVVGLPVVANVSVLYLVAIEIDIAEDKLHVAGLLLFRGSAEICGGLVAICIQIEAGGSVDRVGGVTTLTAQVTFSIDVCLLWVIDLEVTEHWEEQRQIA
jgi:hypothetical protein